MLKVFIVSFTFFMGTYCCFAQKTYQFRTEETQEDLRSGHLKMGDPGDPEIRINSRYMTIDGQPVIPVMGEMHFSRVRESRWEEYLLKMKANGISIIASYVLWIHHEEIATQFDWEGNKNLREFVKLCQKHNLMFVARIGPWCHAEVRNGGTPDWIFEQPGLVDRTNNPIYQKFVKRWYGEIAKQLQGLYWKDGGPIVGVQLENEYRRGSGGDEHILWLKKEAVALGMDVPMYTVTGWGNASIPENEVVPLYGGYPTAPWATHLNSLDKRKNFSFQKATNDPTIGNESGKLDLPRVDLSGYPYFTCELGVGNQISYHRRPVIHPLDGVTISMAKVGSGSNLPGYYVFAGGSNPKGKLTSLEEDQQETGYWNAYPKVSYDFQAAIKETGALAPSYHEIRPFHYFLEAFGDKLAPMRPYIHPELNTENELQLALRSDGKRGFLFGLNYMRHAERATVKDVQFEISLGSKEIKFPQVPVAIPADCNFVWPLNLEVGDRILSYATCQLFGKVETEKGVVWVFKQNEGISPQIAFEQPLEGQSGPVVSIKIPQEERLKWKGADGREHQVLVLSPEQAKNSWILDGKLYLTEAAIYLNKGELTILSQQEKVTLSTWKGTKLKGLKKTKSTQLWDTYEITFDPVETSAGEKLSLPFAGAEWLTTSTTQVTTKTELYHRLFYKEFDINNTSDIKKALFTYFTDRPFRLKVNNRWVNQRTVTAQVGQIDLTGYLQLGKNTLMADFLFHDDPGAWSGELEVVHYNTDMVHLYTDTTWQVSDSYTYPRLGAVPGKLRPPEVAMKRDVSGAVHTYDLTILSIPDNDLNSLYLIINYTGDKAALYLEETLIADHFWNGTPFEINLMDKVRVSSGEDIQLKFRVTPLNPDYKIFFDQKPGAPGVGKIEGIELIPEYKKTVTILD